MKQRGRDHDLFTRQAQFKDIRPSIDVTSPISNDLALEYIDDVKGGNKFPPLRVSIYFPLPLGVLLSADSFYV